MREIDRSEAVTDLAVRCSCGHAVFVHGAEGCLAMLPVGAPVMQRGKGGVRPVQQMRGCPCARPGRETGW
jgi:hypothetical protein